MDEPNFKIEDVLGSRARVKILKELAKAEELSISLLIKRTKLNHSIVNKHLKQLTSLNLVQEKRFGRTRIFRYKIEEPKARSFRSLIDICDFLKGGTIDEIANSHGFSPKYTTSIAKIVFSGNRMNVQHKCRFFRHCDLKEILLSIAEKGKNSIVTKRSFANLKNSYIQELLMRYHKVRESADLNSDTMVVGLDLNFIDRVSNLSDKKLKGIINSSVKKLTNTDLLVMCSKINKDQEILKYIVFSLMKSSITVSTISQISGKSEDFIRECERLIYDEKIAIYD